MKRILKTIAIFVVIIILGFIYLTVTYNIIGPGEKLYCYIFPFMTPKESSAVDLPIGEFIGSKEEIEKVRDASLNYHTASLISERDNNPDAIWPFVVDLPESNSVDPNEELDYIKEKLLADHLWDGKSKINFFAVAKVGGYFQQKENEACDFLSKSMTEYPNLFKDAVEKVKSIKQEEINNTKDFLDSISDKNEREIAENLLLIRRITGITPTSELDLRGLTNNRRILGQVIGEGDFKSTKENIREDVEGGVIGIKVNGDRAILVYGTPDSYYTEVRKFAKVGDRYKLYTIEGVEHTKALNRALNDYWTKKIKSKQPEP